MRRYTGIALLLVGACTLLPPLFVNGLHALQPSVQYKAERRDALIRGLLVPRQYYCPGGYNGCEATGCCPVGWPCCRDGNCCDPGSYCVLATNGIIGCCPDGELCSGPAGEPGTIYPTYTTTHDITSTITNQFTTAFTPTPTTTFTTLLGVPTQSPGTQVIEVSILDVNLTWSAGWVEETSSCSPSITSKSTSTQNSSFTYLFQYSASSTYGYYYYLNLVNYNTMWEVFINGISQSMYYSDSTDNCTYFTSYYLSLSSSVSASQNLTVVVHGADIVGSDTLGLQSWSLAFNKMLITEQNPPSTSTSRTAGILPQNSATPTGFSGFNAAKRTQPHRPLLLFGGVVLAMMHYA